MARNHKPEDFHELLGIMEELHHLKDLDAALLDALLLQARRLTSADAGSIYLVEDNALNFSFLHNETLFSSARTKHLYTSHTLSLDSQSIAGYVACTGKTVVIDDVYEIPRSLPYSFNHFFDDVSGYRTKSLLAIPLKTTRGKIVGVLQIINPLGKDGESIPFTERDRMVLGYFADNAGITVERALRTREMILRMIKMCELRDPQETGAHANRVGAFAAEIYHQWAFSNGISEPEIKKNRDLIRTAAMFHDLGKIAISDLILKKPGGLEQDEFTIMKYHTIYGARLFENPNSEMDVMSGEIALNHHERWDGNGYPGKIADIFADPVQLGRGKQAEEIPLSARIVALADVYDALVSKRVYKEALSEEEALAFIREQAGKQFDPEVVAAFLSIREVIVAIKNRYQEDSTPPLRYRITS
ncbi:MAG: HD domain-containing protein [Deltaproteobacteria bacterium]|nr:HD domain-containing protein [Deltaproteobacteria bacterium]